MSNVQKLIEKGLKAHRAGRAEVAKSFYEQAVKLKPRHPDALNLAGVAALQCGEPEQAARWMKRAIDVAPRNPAFHANLAQACLALEQYADALAAFRRAAELDPREPQFAMGAANCVAQLGDPQQAEQLLREMLQRHPRLALGWFNLARAVAEQGRFEEAAGHYQHTLEIEPGFADAQGALGSVLHTLGRFDEAEQAFRRQFALQPYSEDATNQLASMLIDRGRFAEAIAFCREALAKLPASVSLRLKLGSAMVHGGQVTAALACYRETLSLAPDHPRARWGYGYMLVESGQPQTGLTELDAVLAQHPDAAEFRDSRALIRLSTGDLRGGWDDYRWRAARCRFVAENPALHLTDDLPDPGKGLKVCLLREQGIGDELFFLRFAVLLKTLGAHITYQANRKLAPLLTRVSALDQLIAADEAPPATDALTLIGDLPRLLERHALAPLPPPLAVPALPEQVERMRDRLREIGPPPYIGLTWRAGTAPDEQRGPTWVLYKTVGLDLLGDALRDTPGTWIALQRGPAPGEIEQLAAQAGAAVHDFSALNDDLEAMLALLTLLDDYVGVSNTNMHLRAAVGRAARVLVPKPSEWRWMSAGEESPWFPGFRIYRQDTDGGWTTALTTLARDLRARSSA